jgi:hypothetical protein
MNKQKIGYTVQMHRRNPAADALYLPTTTESLTSGLFYETVAELNPSKKPTPLLPWRRSSSISDRESSGDRGKKVAKRDRIVGDDAHSNEHSVLQQMVQVERDFLVLDSDEGSNVKSSA